MTIKIEDLRFDEKGLIPTIVQDAQSKAVLMMAYMNEESVQKTLETKETWFWSRSRNELWNKGATSGNVQVVKEIRYDCDSDTLLVLVTPKGPACHRGTYSCFEEMLPLQSEQGTGLGTEISSEKGIGITTEAETEAVTELETGSETSFDYEVISELIETIAKRDLERPEGAYTTYLFEQGVDKILKKVGEEASEVIIAAKNRDPEELRNESADLLYHLFVLWREQGLGLGQVIDTLRKRHNQ